MKTSFEHLPERKQRELARIVDLIHEEFADAVSGGTADFKKKGRILKIILFGSYARGTWVDEPHTMKGYRSDYDVLVIVNTRKLAGAEYWHKTTDRLMHDKAVETPVGLIAHSLREMNRFLQDGHYFFSDIRRDGIVLYELDDAALADPKPLNAADAFRVAKEHFELRFRFAKDFAKGSKFYISEGNLKLAAFELHQSIESAYATVLLTCTNYSPPSHNIKFLRSLAEGCDQRLVEAWPRDAIHAVAWFNILNEAYVKARYSRHYEITEEALRWLIERATVLLGLVETASIERLGTLADQVAAASVSQDAAQ